ncbi:MAG: DUF1223 domain-containing protein [Pyrinomonadaceae bacterium]|nr:DUF1223 domain-containing protein [Pyrinomonadaceae bacterium]
MKRVFIFGILFALAGVVGWSLKNNQTVADAQQTVKNQTVAPVKTDKKKPVLVELFTSEGCSSCPPADVNLSRIEKEQPVADVEVITLSLHVDYWNSLGWKDEFSSPIYSRRQQIYSQALKLDSNYTPQMIVDGRTEFVGSNEEKTNKAIAEAAKNQKATVEILQDADKFKIKLSDIPTHETATVFLAVAEDNLASNVRRGENSGRRLAHTSVVRELISLGTLTAEQKTLEVETALQIQSNWKRENLKIVVFVQENVSRKVLGVNQKSLN